MVIKLPSKENKISKVSLICQLSLSKESSQNVTYFVELEGVLFINYLRHSWLLLEDMGHSLSHASCIIVNHEQVQAISD